MTSDSSTPVIRVATLEDAAQLAQLFEIFEAQAVSSAQVTARLEAVQNLEIAILALMNGKTVGLACMRSVPVLSGPTPLVEVSELYVDRPYRDQGIEELLMAEVEALARQRNARQVRLHTGLKNNNAQSFYRSLGYREYALAMRKHLNG